jgi:hypothetical protein
VLIVHETGTQMKTVLESITTKQMGDACEMLVAAELALLGGIPTIKMPDGWPGYDLVAQVETLHRISVKSGTYKPGSGAYIQYDSRNDFDWLALVLLPGIGEARRRIFIIPRKVAETSDWTRLDQSPNTAHLRYWRFDEVARAFGKYENNWRLAQE